MKKICLVLGVLLVSLPAWAASVRLDLKWSVVGTPATPAAQYRIEESVTGAWVVVAKVPASQLTYSIPGRAVGQSYTFSIVPENSVGDGPRSNSSVCGSVVTGPPTTTLTFSCTPTVVSP